jgi:hypothetical protein
MLDCPAKMNILSIPLLVLTGTLGVVGSIGGAGFVGTVGATDGADVPSFSADPPHAAMVAVIRRAPKNFMDRGLLGNSLIRCIVSFYLVDII